VEELVASLIDSSLWIDFTRARSPRSLKQFIAPYVLAPDVALAEPVVFEVLRYASDEETVQLQEQFRLLPLLPTPSSLWTDAAELGRDCRKQGITPSALDLLISSIAIHHAAELVTFDADFEPIAGVSTLKVKLLQRPTP
jgi:predicted nucleic acid-binding protein